MIEFLGVIKRRATQALFLITQKPAIHMELVLASVVAMCARGAGVASIFFVVCEASALSA